jgi:transposase-like protein
MARIKPKNWTREEKTSIVLSLLRNEQSAAELSRKHGVSQTTIGKWKDRFLEAGQAGLGGQKTPSQTREIEVEQLKIALAEAVMVNSVLKKMQGGRS